MSERSYVANLVRLSVMWTAASFCMYIFKGLNKYLPGTIYVHYYIDGIAGIIGYIVGKVIYGSFRIKTSFIIAHVLTIFGATFIFLYQSEIIPTSSISDDESPYEPGSQKDNDHKLSKIIPWFELIAKLGINVSFSCAYQATFSDARVFPNKRRVSAGGIANFIARLITIFAPLVAELDAPIPIYIMLSA